MAKRKPTRQKRPVKTRAEKLLDAVQGNKVARPHVKGKKPWEPTEIQWSWYILWTAKQYSIRQIAIEAKRNFETVRETIHRIQEWEWDALTEERVAIAKRQTRTLEQTFQEAAVGWERSKENAVTVKTEEVSIMGISQSGDMISVPGIKTTTTEAGQAGDASFLNSQMTALKGIRDIWGVEAPKESKIDFGPAALPTVIGESPEDTVRLHLQAELDRLNAEATRKTESA